MIEASSGVSNGRRRRRRRRWIVAAVALFHLLGIASSIDALMSTRTAPGAVAWIVSLSTVPYVAVPAYWVFGRTRFQGYVVGRRDVDSQLHRALQLKTARVHAHSDPPPETRELLPPGSGSSAELLMDGEATFGSLLAGMAAAEHYLLVQFYIVRDDAIGRELKRVMEERARAGRGGFASPRAPPTCWRRFCKSASRRSARLPPAPFDQPLWRLELRLAGHLRALLNPVAEVAT